MSDALGSQPVTPPMDLFGFGGQGQAVQADPSSLIKELGQGFQDAALASPGGPPGAAQPAVSPRDRLLLGGLLLAGATNTGRDVYARWKGSPSATTPVAPPERATQATTELKNLFPGRSDRQLNMMAQADNAGLAAAIARFKVNRGVPDERLAQMAARLDQYEQAAGSEEFAAFDWAKLDESGEAGLLPPEIQPLYDNFADGRALSDDEWLKLNDFASQTTDLESSVGLTGRLHKIIDNNGRPLPVIRYNPPPPGDVFLDPSHREKLVRELNPEAQFSQAVQNIEDLVRRGAAEDGRVRPPSQGSPVVGDDDRTQIFWGVDLDGALPEKSFDQIAPAFEAAARRLEPDFGPLNSGDVAHLAATKWADLVGAHRNKFGGWTDGNPFRLKPNGEENPAFLALIGAGNELPASFGGAAGAALPMKALTTEAAALTLFVDDFDVTPATAASRQADHWMRNMFPGPLGTADGKPRWLAGRPLPLRSFDTLDAGVMDNPTAVVETMHSGAYPGFKPGDYIAFDHTGKLPPWAQTAERMPGGAGRSRPTRSPRKLSQVDLTDENTTRKALNENAWAVFVNPSEKLLAGLQAKRFRPVSLREGGDPAVIVFGNAESFAPDYTHAGWQAEIPDDLDAESLDVDLPESEWVVPTGSGERVALSIPDTPYSEATPRVADRVTRYVYKVDQREAHRIAMLAADLENTGGSNLAVYSRQPEIEGFEAAREHVYQGPAASVKVVRTADPVVGDSNAVPVHVRVDSGLPTRAVNVDPSEVSLAGVEFEDLGGGRVRVNVEDEGDLGRKIRDAADLVHVYGHDNVEVLFEGERISLFQPTPLPNPGRRRAREAYDEKVAEAPPPPETRFWGDVSADQG